ncbi:MAG: GGDEF domain-containing protein, partial [Pseudomonadales bacterium]|nr:GGDEF domain-containing protein [Pseudomonadales bacterium]
FLMMIDLDGFQAINDTYGHHAGDRVLLEVKDRWLANCRMSDVVIRWGGDEFLIIGHARTMDGAEQFTEKIRGSLAAPDYDIGGGHHGQLSGSIGISSIPFVPGNLDFAGWEQVCNVADLASYIAKDSGRNSWVSITGTALMAEEEIVDIKDRLPKLIKERKLRVTHSANTQPVMNNAT